MQPRRCMAILFVVLAFCVSATAPGSVSAQKKARTITVATDATWPPMEMVDTNKNIVGFDIDFMKAVAREAGFEVVFKNTAWDGIFGGLDAGKYDAIISSVTITEERKRQYDFSEPYINIGQILVIPKTVEKCEGPLGHEGEEGGRPDRNDRGF